MVLKINIQYEEQGDRVLVEIEGLLVHPHPRYCVNCVHELYPLLSTGSSNQETIKHDLKIVDRDLKHQYKQAYHIYKMP